MIAVAISRPIPIFLIKAKPHKIKRPRRSRTMSSRRSSAPAQLLHSEIQQTCAQCLHYIRQIRYVCVQDIAWPAGENVLRKCSNLDEVRNAFAEFYEKLAAAAVSARVDRTYLAAIPQDCSNMIYKHFESSQRTFSGWGGMGYETYTSTFLGAPHSYGGTPAKYTVIDNEIDTIEWYKYGKLHRDVGPCKVESDRDRIALTYNYTPESHTCQSGSDEAVAVRTVANGDVVDTCSGRNLSVRMLPKSMRRDYLAAESQVAEHNRTN